MLYHDWIEISLSHYSVSLNSSDIEWCVNNFGEREETVQIDSVWSYISYGKFKFKREEDALLFVLKWS